MVSADLDKMIPTRVATGLVTFAVTRWWGRSGTPRFPGALEESLPSRRGSASGFPAPTEVLAKDPRLGDRFPNPRRRSHTAGLRLEVAAWMGERRLRYLPPAAY